MMVQFDVKRVQKGTESFMVSFDFTKTPVTQIADYIIISASKHNASDIHFDPREDGMMVRFRIDGDCQDYTYVPKAYERNLTTRLKLLANMNITESRLPQDGAIKGMFGDKYLDMRVSALPLNEGEKIVIRILDYSRSLQGIETLGFHPANLDKVKRMMGIPNGIILTTGATGSGKSTTTYSILQGLNKPETNIITVEDPIEMNIEGINQVQVNAEIGMTFAAALRSILRQDPNIILIGEIRDSETAQIAVRASITGHLVLSTIHTNNALATVERLLDMDVERYLLSTALSGIISQRLAKMLCPDCRYQRETTKYEKKVFKKYMNMDVAHVWDANPKGCEHCRRGYRGRIAIHEVLEIDDDIRTALSNEKLEKKDLAKMVYSENTITMLQDALIKCLEGKTSFEEVYRNIEIENEDDDNYEHEMATEIRESIPVEEEVESSDDLLDVSVKKDDKDSVKALVSGPAFTAKDFEDPEPTNNQAQVQNTNQQTQTQTQQVGVQPQPQVQPQQQVLPQTQVQQVPVQAAIKTQLPNGVIPKLQTNNQNAVNANQVNVGASYTQKPVVTQVQANPNLPTTPLNPSI
ncbi:MAG: type II/IV secretion system protein [Bacilli bacterium]|nr:type II/IV secretion system protein [Bacilli bacterium]